MHIELGADYTGDSEIYQGVCVNQIMYGGRRFFSGWVTLPTVGGHTVGENMC
jgi:hypothetical protein